jgi:type VI protein secretion system component VasK
MWKVEANNRNGEFFTKSALTLAESREIHSTLSNSGQWAVVRSFDAAMSKLMLDNSNESLYSN